MKKMKKTDKKGSSSSVEKSQTVLNIAKICLYVILICSACVGFWILLGFAGIVPTIQETIEAWRDAALNFPSNSTQIPGNYTF